MHDQLSNPDHAAASICLVHDVLADWLITPPALLCPRID
jgi:hypothetical protein